MGSRQYHKRPYMPLTLTTHQHVSFLWLPCWNIERYLQIFARLASPLVTLPRHYIQFTGFLTNELQTIRRTSVFFSLEHSTHRAPLCQPDQCDGCIQLKSMWILTSLTQLSIHTVLSTTVVRETFLRPPLSDAAFKWARGLLNVNVPPEQHEQIASS